MTMIIRTEQMQAMEDDSMRRFEDRLMAHLREMYPERVEDYEDDELREFCSIGIERANDYDIRSEYDVSRFLEYIVYLGEDFDKVDWIEALLLCEESGTYKMDSLDNAFRPKEITNA